MSTNTNNLINFVFDIANKLRGPYRPPQYRKVMLPMTVLRCLDCVLAPTSRLYRDRDDFEYDLKAAFRQAGEKLPAPLGLLKKVTA